MEGLPKLGCCTGAFSVTKGFQVERRCGKGESGEGPEVLGGPVVDQVKRQVGGGEDEESFQGAF